MIKNQLKNQIDMALGRKKADLVIKNCQLLNVITEEITRSDIAIAGHKIVGIYEEYEGHEAIEGTGLLERGFVVVKDGQVIAELALPLAGLMSFSPLEEVQNQLKHIREIVKSQLNCPLAEPFLQLAFLPLPVIPHLKITDHGLVDVNEFKIIEA